MKEVSELRQDPVSHEWVVIATGRAKRPDDFKSEKKEASVTPISACPFENLDATEHKKVFKNDWVTVIENKYPLVEGDMCGLTVERGPYKIQPGVGRHEVVVTADHTRSLGQMSSKEALKVIEAYQNRYRALAELDCSRYVLIFHNHGAEAGASLSHPHSQIIAIPIVPPDLGRSLAGSKRYHDEHGRCVHCEMIARDRADGRVVFENEFMSVVSPYVPQTAFNLRIYPREHEPYFEDVDKSKTQALAEALRVTLGKIFRGLNDIAYNFFIHTAPVFERDRYGHYHWHIEILPKPPTPPAGFEFGTHVNVSAIDPDDAAEYLRGVSTEGGADA